MLRTLSLALACRRWAILLILTGLFGVSCGQAPEEISAPPTPAAPQREPDRVLTHGEWELRIWYRAHGTRSEGQHGELRLAGADLQGSTVGEERDTDLGRMQYYGSGVANVLWEPTGWNYADRDRIQPSWTTTKE